jgi:NTE family protein
MADGTCRARHFEQEQPMNEPCGILLARGPDAGKPPRPAAAALSGGANPGPAGAPRTAFVFAGGSALAAMQAGMLQALYERGISPDLLVGTSAGALNAAYVASRPQTADTARELAAVWCHVRRRDVFPLRPATLLSGLTGRSDHLVPDQGLRQLAVRHLHFSRIEEARIPLHLIAYDLLAGREVRLSAGPAVEAVLATAAVPGLLPPVPFGRRLLVDGGVSNNTPISHAIALGAQRVYVLPTAMPDPRTRPGTPHGARRAAAGALAQLLGARLQADLTQYAREAEIIVLPAVNTQYVPLTSFTHAGQLAAQALLAARTTLAAHDARPAPARAS